MLAAVPAVDADNSDGGSAESIDIVAAGYISDADTAKAVLKSLRGISGVSTSTSFDSITTGVMFVVYETTGSSLNVTKTVLKDGTQIGEAETATNQGAGLHSFYFYVGPSGENIVSGDGAIIGDDFDPNAGYTITLAKTADGTTQTTAGDDDATVGDSIEFKGADSIVGDKIELQSDLEVSKSISIKADELDLNGNGVTVKNGATLTLEAASFTTEFLKNRNTAKTSSVSAEDQDSAAVVTNKALAATDDNKGKSLVMSNGKNYGGIAFVAKSGASMEFYSQDSKVSTLQTGSGNTTIAIDGEGSKLIYDAGSAQNVGVILTGKASASISTLAGTSFAGYFSLDGSTLTADRINAYSINLVGSTMTVEDLAFYPGDGTNGYSNDGELNGLETATATVGSGSLLKATGAIFTNGFYTADGFSMKAIVFDGLGFVEGDLAFVNDMVTSNAKRTNLAGFALSGITYTGTVSYTCTEKVNGKDVVVTSTADFKNVQMPTGNNKSFTIKAGSIDLGGELGTAVDGGKSSLTVTGDIVVSEDVTVPEGFTLVIEGTVTAAEGKKIVNKGTIQTATGADVTGVEIKNEDEGTVVSTQDESSMIDAFLSGKVSGATFEADQKVTIDKDTEIRDGKLVIKGLLVVNEGVTLTIDAGAQLVIQNNANVRILGTLEIVASDVPTIKDGELVVEFGTVEITGGLDVDGVVKVQNGSLVIASGASAEVADIQTAKDTGKAVVSSDATLTITGAVSKDSSFEVAGELIIESSAVSGSFEVLLDQGTLDIVKVVLGETVTKGNTTTDHTCSTSSITVTDKGVEVWDKDKKMALPNGAPTEGNKFVIDEKVATKYADGVVSYNVDYGYGVAISGITVASAMKETKIVYDSVNAGKTGDKSTKVAGTSVKYATSATSEYIGKYEHAYTMTVSGSISASAELVYDGLQDKPTVGYATTTTDSKKITEPLASFTLTGNVAAVIGDALVLPTDTVMSVSAGSTGSVVIDGAVALAAEVRTADEKRAGAVLTVGPSTASADSKASIKGPVTIGAGASLIVNASTTVSGSIDATAVVTGSFPAEAALTNNVALTMDGAGVISAVGETKLTNLSSSNFVGAYYEIGSGTSKAYRYVAVDTALAALADGTTDSISLYGENTVKTGAVVASGDAINMMRGSELIIGSSTNTDVDLVISSGAALRDSSSDGITVNGSLYAEKKTDIASSLRAGVKSEVYSYQTNERGDEIPSGWAKWTSLASALKTAKSGETIELKGDVPDFRGTIPEGVTVDAHGKTLTVKKNSVVTIDGILDLTSSGSKLILTQKAANSTDKDGSVVLNGRITYLSEDSIVLGSSAYTVAGAYYEYDDTLTISTVAFAASIIADVEEQKVTIKQATGVDTALDLGSVSFAGKAADDGATVIITCDAIGTVGLQYAKAVVSDGKNVDLVFESVDGSAAILGDATDLVVIHGTYGSGDDAKDVLQVSGTLASFKTSDASDKVEPVVVLGGTVYIVGTLQLVEATTAAQSTGNTTTVSGTVTVSVGGEVSVVKGDNAADVDAEKLVVDGNLTVASGTLDASEALIEGALAVMDSIVTFGKATVFGAIDASDLDDNGVSYTGTVSVGTMFIGVEEESVYSTTVTAGEASVVGNVKITKFAVAVAGAVVPAGWSADDAAAGTATALNLKSTIFMDENGNEFITVYVKDTTSSNGVLVDSFFKDVPNAKFLGWTNSEGKTAVKTDTVDGKKLDSTKYEVAYVGSPKWTIVSASINEFIFDVTIVTDGSISSVTLNGILMGDKRGTFGTASSIKAGTYTVAFSAASGYDVSGVKLSDSQGNAIEGFTIVIDDDSTVDGKVSYQLTGGKAVSSPSGGSSSGGSDFSGIIDAIDKNTEAVKNQENGGSSDSSLTDILLIVLVVLIVIMAILVAMRMMRS